MKKILLIGLACILCACAEHDSTSSSGSTGGGGDQTVTNTLEENLYIASWRGLGEDETLLKEHLSNQFNIDHQFQKENLNTLLISAVRADKVNIVKLLLQFEPDLTIKNNEKKTAIDEVKSDVVKKLLSGEIVDVDKSLLEAASAGDKNAFSDALSAGANINAIDADGRSSLMYACMNGHTSIVKIVLKKKGDLNLRDSSDKTALVHAKENGHNRIAKFLEKYGAE